MGFLSSLLFLLTMGMSASFDDVEEVTKAGVPIILLYGDKNSGKTSFAYKLWEATYGVMSFDEKSFQPMKTVFADSAGDAPESLAIKEQVRGNVHVLNGVEKLVRPPRPRVLQQTSSGGKKHVPITKGEDRSREYLMSCVESYEWTQHLLDYMEQKLKPEVGMLDCLEVIHEICEMTMRADNGYKAFQGIENWSVWKERNLNVDHLLQRMKKFATKGIIITTFCKLEKVVRRGTVKEVPETNTASGGGDGRKVMVEKVPKYLSSVMRETDVIIYCYSLYDMGDARRHFYADIVTSKLPEFPTGKTYDVTGPGYFKADITVTPPLGSIPDATMVGESATKDYTEEDLSEGAGEEKEKVRGFNF